MKRFDGDFGPLYSGLAGIKDAALAYAAPVLGTLTGIAAAKLLTEKLQELGESHAPESMKPYMPYVAALAPFIGAFLTRRYLRNRAPAWVDSAALGMTLFGTANAAKLALGKLGAKTGEAPNVFDKAKSYIPLAGVGESVLSQLPSRWPSGTPDLRVARYNPYAAGMGSVTPTQANVRPVGSIGPTSAQARRLPISRAQQVAGAW